MTDVLQAAEDIKAARTTLVADAAKAHDVILGPATGDDSTVDLGGDAGEVKTLARVMADAAGRVGLQYQFSTATNTTITPGAGKIAFNNANLALATEMAISALDVNALSFASWIASWDQSTTLLNRGQIVIQTLRGDALALVHIVDDTITGSGFYRLKIEYDGGGGSFGNLAEIAALFIKSGDRGGTFLVPAIFDGGKPLSGEIIWRQPVPKPCTFLAGLTESEGTLIGLPTADATFSLRWAAKATPLDTIEFGTATFPAGSRVPVFASGSDQVFARGDILEIAAPDPLDETLSAPSLTLVGHTL